MKPIENSKVRLFVWRYFCIFRITIEYRFGLNMKEVSKPRKSPFWGFGAKNYFWSQELFLGPRIISWGRELFLGPRIISWSRELFLGAESENYFWKQRIISPRIIFGSQELFPENYFSKNYFRELFSIHFSFWEL